MHPTKKIHKLFSSKNDPKNLKELIATLKNEMILTLNFLPAFIDIITYYRLKQISHCGYEMTKNVQKPLA